MAFKVIAQQNSVYERQDPTMDGKVSFWYFLEGFLLLTIPLSLTVACLYHSNVKSVDGILPEQRWYSKFSLSADQHGEFN